LVASWGTDQAGDADTGDSDGRGSAPKEDPCDKLTSQAYKVLYTGEGQPHDKSLLRRYIEQIFSNSGPGTDEWKGHEEQMQNYINTIRNLIKKMDDNDCPKPPWIQDFNGRDVLQEAERRWNVVHVDLPRAIGGLALGYGLYRVVRLFPSLLPPLWWTLPANVAIP
jgi:hypothetical protein